MNVFQFFIICKRTNNANNATHYVKLGKKRRESSKRNYYIISPRVIIKAIIIMRRCNNFRSLSWWLWTQTPTWTLCPSLTIQINMLCMLTPHLSWSFLTLPSITCHRSTLLGLLLARIQSNAFSSLVCQSFAPLSTSTWYHRSQVFLVLKHHMLSSDKIDAICVFFLSSSVHFSWAPDKNRGCSWMVYHLFVNGVTISCGTRLFPKLSQ